MTEIRTITADEAEGYLSLVCEVFDLDASRARSVFFTEPYFDLDRKWALFLDGEIVTTLTTTPLAFGWGRAMGIAGVATSRIYRQRGFASELLDHVLRQGSAAGEGPALLYARDTSLYLRHGFEVLDAVVRGPIHVVESDHDPEPLDFAEVQRRYNAWAATNPSRLVRDEQRWRFWNWHYRVCEPFHDGYIASEPGLLREAVFDPPADGLPVPKGSEWFGLRSIVGQLGIPMVEEFTELQVMARGFPSPPQMFMTDQF